MPWHSIIFAAGTRLLGASLGASSRSNGRVFDLNVRLLFASLSMKLQSPFMQTLWEMRKSASRKAKGQIWKR